MKLKVPAKGLNDVVVGVNNVCMIWRRISPLYFHSRLPLKQSGLEEQHASHLEALLRMSGGSGFSVYSHAMELGSFEAHG